VIEETILKLDKDSSEEDFNLFSERINKKIKDFLDNPDSKGYITIQFDESSLSFQADKVKAFGGSKEFQFYLVDTFTATISLETSDEISGDKYFHASWSNEETDEFGPHMKIWTVK
jgi:hypothetical protein